LGGLGDPDQRLDELSQGDAQLRTGFATSYHTLDTHAARLYRLLGLLDVPDFPVWIAAALLDTTPSTAEQLLERLVEADGIVVPVALCPRQQRRLALGGHRHGLGQQVFGHGSPSTVSPGRWKHR
ncbi:hypothetical protein ACFQ1S_42375, partial [Kibdelosporangium lantanae]